MPLPLRQVAWECGDCATTNRGREQLPCSYCRAENPRRYEILAGSAPAATARTTYVMCSEQHVIVREASDGGVSVVPRPVVNQSLLAERLRGTMVDIVGTETGENGRSCHAHEVCGMQLIPGSKVRIRKETVISPTTGDEEDCLVAYVVGKGVMTCKVGYLPRHLAILRADDYDGMYASVIEVYSPRSLNRNVGIRLVVVIIPDNRVTSIAELEVVRLVRVITDYCIISYKVTVKTKNTEVRIPCLPPRIPAGIIGDVFIGRDDPI
jgi:hypothetical protein